MVKTDSGPEPVSGKIRLTGLKRVVSTNVENNNIDEIVGNRFRKVKAKSGHAAKRYSYQYYCR